MRVPGNAPAEVQQSFREIWAALDLLTNGNIDLGKRRIVNAGDAVNDADYLTKRQFGAQGASGNPLIVDELTVKKIFTLLGALKLRQVGLVSSAPGVLSIVKGDGVTLATIYASKFQLSGAQAYTTTNVTTLRGGDFSALNAADVRSTLGTLITDLRAAGLVT